MITYNLTDGSVRGLGSPCGGFDIQKGMGAVDVTTSPALPVMLTNGWLNAFYVNQTTGEVARIPGVTFSNDYEQAFYNGQPLINGTRLPTPYMESSSVTTSGNWCTYLDGLRHYLQTPLPRGPIYMRVITDQGAIVTNGTVFASNRAGVTDWQGSDNYCVYLSADTNATGFMQVTETLFGQGGVYNFTVVANYGANQSARVAIPDIVVQPHTVSYLTVSIPSGQVTMVTVTCNPGEACSTATATSSKGG